MFLPPKPAGTKAIHLPSYRGDDPGCPIKLRQDLLFSMSGILGIPTDHCQLDYRVNRFVQYHSISHSDPIDRLVRMKYQNSNSKYPHPLVPWRCRGMETKR
jgi:hypothetical protein